MSADGSSIVGGLLGVHCGDSLGATFEFAAANASEPLRDIVGGGAFGWAAGEATDDTDLTLAVARAYAAVAEGQAKDTPEDLARHAAGEFVAWKRRGPRDIGTTTASALLRIEGGADPLTAGEDHERSAANGGLMRCLPTGLARPDRVTRQRESELISAVTHREPRCLDAVVAYNDLAALLLAGQRPWEAVEATLGWLGDEGRDARVCATLAGAREAVAMPFQTGGYVLTSLAIAVWAVCQTHRTSEDVLIEVCNAGGDADTNGAIAGGLLGVRDGAGTWPDRWVTVLHRGAELTDLAEPLRQLREAARS